MCSGNWLVICVKCLNLSSLTYRLLIMLTRFDAFKFILSMNLMSPIEKLMIFRCDLVSHLSCERPSVRLFQRRAEWLGSNRSLSGCALHLGCIGCWSNRDFISDDVQRLYAPVRWSWSLHLVSVSLNGLSQMKQCVAFFKSKHVLRVHLRLLVLLHVGNTLIWNLIHFNQHLYDAIFAYILP